MFRISLKVFRWLLSLGSLFIAFLLLAAPFYIYSNFNSETAIAELEFDKISDQYYLAHLSTGDFCTTDSFSISGDQWQLDAQFMKWNGLAVMLGLESHYRLDRLSGRYADIEQQNDAINSAFDLSPKLFLDFFSANNFSAEKGLLIDTLYGSSVYMKIDTTKRYRVYKTEDALIVRSEERALPIHKGGVLTISITKACETKRNLFSDLSQKINQLAITLH